jgi:hypothetical protein
MGEFGKNHLGDHTASLPTAHGFQESWGYLNHLDAMQQALISVIKHAEVVLEEGEQDTFELLRAGHVQARRTAVHHDCESIQTREEISWHKVASGWIWSSQSVAVAITTTERRLPENRLRKRARRSRSHSNRLAPGGRLSPP